jgi:hypothetical protein
MSDYTQLKNEADAAHILAQADEIRAVMAGGDQSGPIIDAFYTEVTREEAEGRRLPTHLPESGS